MRDIYNLLEDGKEKEAYKTYIENNPASFNWKFNNVREITNHNIYWIKIEQTNNILGCSSWAKNGFTWMFNVK